MVSGCLVHTAITIIVNPIKDIREDVGRRAKRDLFMQVVSRKHLITKKDVRNAEVKVRDRTIIRHENDARSVELAVAELQQESYNPVMAFKIQGCTDKYPNLPQDTFLIVIQTEFQKELYQMYGKSVLCIDSTHGTNAYKFKLITCMVRDHFGQGTINYNYGLITIAIIIIGQPVGWCISDRETTEIITIFLQCMKETSPDTDISVVMTDDGKAQVISNTISYTYVIDNTGWVAARKVFGDSVRHLLCSWHVHRYFKANYFLLCCQLL